MQIQGALSRLQAWTKWTFVSTCRVRRLALLRFTKPSAAGLSVHTTIVPAEQLHILLHLSLVAIPSHAPPTRTQTNHVLFLVRKSVHKIPRVFIAAFDPNGYSKVTTTVLGIWLVQLGTFRLLHLCSSGSSPALTVRLSRRTRRRTPFHPCAVLPRPAPRNHPLPTTPFQCPRSRTATLG